MAAITVVGIGEDGWDGLSAKARKAVQGARVVIGGKRHFGLVPEEVKSDQKWQEWPSPIKPFLLDLAANPPENLCILASGDPMLYGVGATLAKNVTKGVLQVIPHISSFSLICAEMLWPIASTVLVNACSQPLETLNQVLFDGAKIVLFSSGAETPHATAKLLVDNGFADSELTIFEHIGSDNAKRSDLLAWQISGEQKFACLNAVAIKCRAATTARIFSPASGLPDDVYEHDGQITRQEVRAITIARLSPHPGELLWDLGAGAGSIAIEWMRAAFEARAIAVEINPKRAKRIGRNALKLGVPKLQIINNDIADTLGELPKPDAIFIGGGISAGNILDVCWQRLKPGGRMVINAVTIEAENILYNAARSYGGGLARLEISHARPLGDFTGWQPSRPITQWSVVKGR
jgi:precorrin-6Y C5,15-methyltransferase (decarboxylating)